MKSVEQRFNEKIDKNGPLIIGTRCWTWTAAKYYEGYGQFWLRGKLQRAHRVAFELKIGMPVGQLQVLHRCDNPSCVNPAHLWPGTNLENRHDMIKKGRHHFQKPNWRELTWAKKIGKGRWKHKRLINGITEKKE